MRSFEKLFECVSKSNSAGLSLTVTKCTPASINRQASSSVWPNSCLPNLSLSELFSFERSNAVRVRGELMIW